MLEVEPDAVWTVADRDPQSKEPHFKQCAVRLLASDAEASVTEKGSNRSEPDSGASAND